MDLQTIWLAAEPYIMTLVGALGGGTIIYTLARVLLGRLLNKFAAKYDITNMADKVANRLVGKTVNIDVTAVAEKKLDKIDRRLSEKIEVFVQEMTAYKHLLTLMGGAVSRFKALTEQERQALVEAVQILDSGYTPPEPEQLTTVVLEPMDLTEGQQTEDKSTDQTLRLD